MDYKFTREDKIYSKKLRVNNVVYLAKLMAANINSLNESYKDYKDYEWSFLLADTFDEYNWTFGEKQKFKYLVKKDLFKNYGLKLVSIKPFRLKIRNK